MVSNPADDQARQHALAPLKAVARARDDRARERAGSRRVLSERRYHISGRPVEELVATAEDRRDREPHGPERGPSSAGPVVGKHVLDLTGAIQADVASSAPVAPCPWHQPLRIAPGDSLRAGHATAKLAPAEPLGLGRRVGDRSEQDYSGDPPIAGPARVVEHLVRAGRM